AFTCDGCKERDGAKSRGAGLIKCNAWFAGTLTGTRTFRPRVHKVAIQCATHRLPAQGDIRNGKQSRTDPRSEFAQSHLLRIRTPIQPSHAPGGAMGHSQRKCTDV